MKYQPVPHRFRSTVAAMASACALAAPLAAHAQQADAPPADAVAPAATDAPVAPAAAAPIAVSATAPAAPAAAVAAPSDPIQGRVVRQSGMRVELRGEGFARGQSVEFVRARRDRDPTADEPEAEAEAEVVAVGQIVATGGGRALARVGLAARVPPGLEVRRSSQPFQAYPLAPERASGVLSVEATARSYLPVNAPVGLGGLAGFDAVYRFDAPVALRASFGSLGFVTSAPVGVTALGHGFVTLDTRYFEVGLGLGGMTVPRTGYSCNNSSSLVTPQCSVGSSVSLAQFVRLGAVDGLMAQVQTDVYVSDQRFEFGNTTAKVQVPVSDAWWVQLRGGGGAAGFGYGEVAVRHRVRGNGDHDSLFVTGSFGGAAVAVPGRFVAGPSVGVGLEWRL